MISYDLNEAHRLLILEPPMRRLMDIVGPCTLELRDMHDPFQALMRSIVYQQLSGKAAGTIYRRVCALFDREDPPSPEEILDIEPERLRGAGLSRAKTLAVKDLSEKAQAGVVPPTLEALKAMSDEEILQRLTTVRGIGPWTVQMVLIFNLGRPDVWPVTDLGVQNGFRITYDLEKRPTPKELRAYGVRFMPYRSVASWYLWRAVEVDGNGDW